MAENKLFVGSLPGDISKEDLNTVFGTYGEVKDIHVLGGDGNRSATGQACAFIVYGTPESCDTAIQALNGVYKIRENEPNAISVSWAKPRGANGGKDKGKGGWGGKGDFGGGFGGGGYGGGFGGKGCGGGGGSWGDSWGGKGCGGGGGGWDGGKGGSWGGDGGKGGGWGGGKGGCGGGGGGNRLFVGNLPSDISEEALQYVFKTYGNVTKTHVMAGKSKSGQSCAIIEYEKAEEADTAIQTLHEKYEIKPGSGVILVKHARSGGKGSGPY